MTWLLFVNYYLLQWFFIRLARVIDDGTGKQIGWTVVVRKPMTGWTYD
jgi:hypothetical protein